MKAIAETDPTVDDSGGLDDDVRSQRVAAVGSGSAPEEVDVRSVKVFLFSLFSVFFVSCLF